MYWFQCGKLVWDKEYIGETSRTIWEIFKEHLKAPSPIHHHSNNTGHITTQDNFLIPVREDHGIASTFKESIYIRVSKPILNGNIGNFNLHHTWDRVFLILQSMLSPPSLTPPCTISQVPWSMLSPNLGLSMSIELPRTHVRRLISILPQTWWSLAVGWMKASLNSTKVLFQRIYNLKNLIDYPYTIMRRCARNWLIQNKQEKFPLYIQHHKSSNNFL